MGNGTNVKFRVGCPRCRTDLLIHPGVIGHRLRCPMCEDLIHVPYPIAERVDCDGDAIPAIVAPWPAMAG